MCVNRKALQEFPVLGNSYKALYALIQKRASLTTYARRCISLFQMFVVEKGKRRQGRQLLFENLNTGYSIYSLSLSLSLSLSNKLDETTKSEEQNCAKKVIFFCFISMCVSAKIFLSF